jgi:uncharacterized delta-60 repeat protein
VALQPNGKIIVGGFFTSVDGQTRNRIARLGADGAVESTDTFNPGVGANDAVHCVAVQPDGKILVGGRFTSFNGQPRFGIARLHADGSLESTATFDPGQVTRSVYSIALQADGKILLGGSFLGTNITRLNSDGTVERIATFNPGFGAGDAVWDVAIQADGKILLGGLFSTVNAQIRNHVARLINDPANQTLTIPSSARVQWDRGGSAPEVQDVTFELSTNGGASWTALAPGTRVISGWECAGLKLPSDGAIRARGRAVGDYFNGSSSLVEQSVTFGATTPFRYWKAALLGDGDAPNDSDSDLDGLRTIVEYATGADPRFRSVLPTPRTVANRLALSFPRNTTATDVALTVQGSDDLSTWTDLARSMGGAAMVPLVTGVSVAEIGIGRVRTVEVRDLYLTTDPAHPRRFLRLHAAPENGAVLPYALRPRHRRAPR